jgi:hypothetical protein
MTEGKKSLSDEEWIGKSIVEICEILGQPDALDPAQYYSAKFEHGTPSVVVSYDALKKRWYLSREGLVLGVVPMKE